MGVSLLETYIEAGHPNDMCTKVSLREMSREYWQRAGRKPVMVVDGSCFQAEIYNRFEGDRIYGGNLQKFVLRLRLIVEWLKQMGWELVFFFDGPTPYYKRYCRKLRNKSKEQQASLLKNVEQPYEVLNKTNLRPILVSTITRFVLKYECGCKVYTTVEECDLEMSSYASRNTCLALLTRDTDFMFFKSTLYYLSVRRLNMDDGTTLCYNRLAVMCQLGLNHQQMALFATLLGNDFVPTFKLKAFHGSICSKVQDVNEKVRAVARYVKTASQQSGNQSDKLLDVALQDVCHEKAPADLREKMRNSFLWYRGELQQQHWVTDGTYGVDWQRVLEVSEQRHVECDAWPDVYATLLGMPYEIPQLMGNARKGYDTSQLFSALRQRVYGVLLHERPPSAGAKTITEFGIWQGVWHDKEELKATPLPEGVSHPGLVALWTTNTPHVCRQRWTLFTTCIGGQLDAKRLAQLNICYVVPTVLLYYLQHCCDHFLTDVELRAIIKHTVAFSMAPFAITNKGETPVQPTVDTIQLCNIMAYGITIVLFAMSALGFDLGKAMPCYYFDGLHLAHCMKAERTDKEIEVVPDRLLFKEDVDTILSIITNNKM